MEEKSLQAQKIDIIGNLAAGLAHDINNILTPILGTASILRRKVKDDPQWVRYINNIEDSARRGSTITQSLNTFGRRDKPRVHVADVNEIIDRSLLLLQETLPKLISIKSELAPGPLIVDADEGLVQQALLNLCLNSRDAMPKGGLLSITSGTIVLEDEKAAQLPDGKPGSYVVISVKDSGSGIPAAIRNRIFEPFFTTKEPGKGTGLGLSVVYGIVRSHNGYINLEESEVDSGTVFAIYLPRVMDERRLKPERQKAAEPAHGTERILLIEDEVAVGEVGADILKELGYSVEVVRNGDEVDRQFSPEDLKRFDLIILDMNMPKMGGKETFKYIKKRLPSMKVLICTGYIDVMSKDPEFSRAIDGFLQKPYELADIAEKVRSILDRTSAASGYPRN
jgi:two-component system cell cycle sensor histidine kinase/response regulator CckA